VREEDFVTFFLGLGIAGVALLTLSLVFDGVLDGLFDGLVSLPVIAGFMSMVGFGGALTLGTTGLGTGPAAVIGVCAGVATGWLVWKLSRALMRDRTTATPRSADLVGSAGAVVTPIPVDGYGEVLVRVAGQPVKLAAKSAVPVARGTEVWVEASLSATSVTVRPVEH
jgi:membrane protein implicated in regulation of membrane protease activity